MEINPELTKKQKQTLRILLDHSNGISEVAYGGAAGGGKSFIGCLFLILSCISYPGSRWLMGRSKLLTLKQSTLKTFFEVTQKLKLKEGEHFKYNQQNNIITFYNGSEILLKDLFTYPSDPSFDSLGSIEISGAFIDECNQISEKAKNIVMSRIRFKLDEFNISPKMFMSCNPSKGWIYNEFYKKFRDQTLEPHKAFIPALVSDNKFITKHYITNLEKLDDISKRRLLYGEWEYSDSLSLFNYDSIIDLFECEEPPSFSGDIVLSIDVARLGKDKTCIIIWDGLTILNIVETSKLRFDEQAKIIKELQTKYGITNKNIIIDTDGVGGGLADMFKGCIEIINNSRPLLNENYQNLKTQLYFKLADKVNTGQIKILNVHEDIKLRLTQELQVIKREGADLDGKIKMTPKDKMKQQIGRSPDISDAMAFRMYHHIKSLKKEFNYSFKTVDL